MAIKMKKEKEGKGFEWIEVHSVHEINVVKVYNKEIEKQRKRDQTYHSRCVSMDQLFDEHDFEFSSDEPSILDRLIEEEEKEEERRLIFNAIRELTLIQQHVIIEHFWNNKSINQIARERGVDPKATHKSYCSALEKLRKKLKNLQK